MPAEQHMSSCSACLQVLGCREAADFEQHVCPNDCMRFKPLPRSKWRRHQDDTCQHCGCGRFVQRTRASGNCPVPAKRFWYFGVQRVGEAHAPGRLAIVCMESVG
jgi:hypothetical protein